MKIASIKILSFLLLIVLLLSCNEGTKTIDNKGTNYINGINFPDFKEPNSGLGNLKNYQDTITIIVEHSDCGEWGGHIEQIQIYRNEDNDLFSRFIVDSVSCEKIKDYNDFSDIDDETRVIVTDTIKHLTENDEKLFNLFLHRVFELCLNKEDLFHDSPNFEVIFMDSGDYIQIFNSHKSFMITYWNEDQFTNTWYGRIRKEIFNAKSFSKK